MGVLQLPHPLPIKTDSDNNILIYSPELDGPAHAAQPISSWTDVSALQSLPPEIPKSLIGPCAGLAGFFQAGLRFAHGPGWARRRPHGPGRAGPPDLKFYPTLISSTELLVTEVYWHRSAQQWECGTYADDKQSSWDMMFEMVDRNYHGYVRNG